MNTPGFMYLTLNVQHLPSEGCTTPNVLRECYLIEGIVIFIHAKIKQQEPVTVAEFINSCHMRPSEEYRFPIIHLPWAVHSKESAWTHIYCQLQLLHGCVQTHIVIFTISMCRVWKLFLFFSHLIWMFNIRHIVMPT